MGDWTRKSKSYYRKNWKGSLKIWRACDGAVVMVLIDIAEDNECRNAKSMFSKIIVHKTTRFLNISFSFHWVSKFLSLFSFCNNLSLSWHKNLSHPMNLTFYTYHMNYDTKHWTLITLVKQVGEILLLLKHYFQNIYLFIFLFRRGRREISVKFNQ